MLTPYFIAYPKKIEQNYLIMQKTLPVDRLFYSTKPNVEDITLKTLAGFGAKFDIVKLKEMRHLIQLGVNCADIICSLPVKSSYEIKTMYKLGCGYFVFDCLDEYYKIKRLAPNALKIARISIKDNSDNKIEYGITKNELNELIDSGEHPDGYTFYILDVASKLDVVKKALDDIVMFMHRQRHVGRQILNIGGNYPLPDPSSTFFYAELLCLIKKIRNEFPNLEVIAEPGRSIVTDAFDLVTQVLAVKHNNEIYLDAHSQIIKLPPQSISVIGSKKTNLTHYYFYENLCSHYLLFEADLPYILTEGTKMVLKGCGAYSSCFANRFHATGLPRIKVAELEEKK